MTEVKKCISCELVARRDKGNVLLWDSILRTPFWDVVHCKDTALLGWTVLSATYCIENEHELLHNDNDFDGYEKHLGLQVVYP